MNSESVCLKIESINRKLSLLRILDAECRLFGAQEHKYRPNEVFTREEVNEFASSLNIQFPEEYVEFICQIGNGGAGPGYGLFSLEKSLEESSAGSLASSFPHRQPWQPLFGGSDWQELERAGKLDEYMNAAVSEDQAELYRQWEDDYFSSHYTQGSLNIGHQGCGHQTLLVISGPERGKIWGDSRCSSYGIFPEHVGFLDWYEAWLDQSLGKAKGFQ